jgi:hypothetical protein
MSVLRVTAVSSVTEMTNDGHLRTALKSFPVVGIGASAGGLDALQIGHASEIAELKQDNGIPGDDPRSSVGQMESSNEELKASNEEILT